MNNTQGLKMTKVETIQEAWINANLLTQCMDVGSVERNTLLAYTDRLKLLFEAKRLKDAIVLISDNHQFVRSLCDES